METPKAKTEEQVLEDKIEILIAIAQRLQQIAYPALSTLMKKPSIPALN